MLTYGNLCAAGCELHQNHTMTGMRSTLTAGVSRGAIQTDFAVI